MCDNSDSDDYYLSEDALNQYEKQKAQDEEQRKIYELNKIRRRRIYFENYYDHNINVNDSIFKLKGFECVTFAYKLIKFKIKPCLLADYVSAKLLYSIVLKYKRNHWYMSRFSTLPLDLKRSFYRWFCKINIDDRDIEILIKLCHEKVVEWSHVTSEIEYRIYQRYRNGEEIYLNSDEEDMFLSDNEKEEVRRKREIIWNRMLPPENRPS